MLAPELLTMDMVENTTVLDEATVARAHLRAVAEEAGMSFAELLHLWSDDTALQLTSAGAALAAGNLAEAARLAHGAAGASGICGVAALADELKMVEALSVEGRCEDARAALATAQVRFTRLSGALENFTGRIES